MRFLIDAQLPPSLAVTLREHGLEGHPSIRTAAAARRDQVIWTCALKESFVLATKDEDFAEWSRLRPPARAVLWSRLGNLRNQNSAQSFPLSCRNSCGDGRPEKRSSKFSE